MSLPDAVAYSPLLSLLGWTALAAFTLGAAGAAGVVLVRAGAPRMTSRWQHRLVLLVYAISVAAALAVASMPRRPVAASVQTSSVRPLTGALVPAVPGGVPAMLGSAAARRSNSVQAVVG